MNNSDTKVKVLIAYLFSFLGGIVIYLIEPTDRFVKFHAMQSILLGLCLTVVWLAGFVLGWVPLIGFAIRVIRWLSGIVFLIATIVCIVKGMGGEEYRLPLIGDKAMELSSR